MQFSYSLSFNSVLIIDKIVTCISVTNAPPIGFVPRLDDLVCTVLHLIFPNKIIA